MNLLELHSFVDDSFVDDFSPTVAPAPGVGEALSQERGGSV